MPEGSRPGSHWNVSSSAPINFYLMVDIVELFVDEGLGKVLLIDDLANRAVLEELHLLRATDATAEREHTAFSRI